MPTTPDPVWDQNFDRLREVAQSFFQAYRLTGTIIMRFGVRSMADSDGNSVVDVYASPRDQEAACTLTTDQSARHMQFLEFMVPASLLGYEIVLRISPEGTHGIKIHVLEIIAPICQGRNTFDATPTSCPRH